MKRRWLIVLTVAVVILVVGVLMGVYFGHGGGSPSKTVPLVTTSH